MRWPPLWYASLVPCCENSRNEAILVMASLRREGTIPVASFECCADIIAILEEHFDGTMELALCSNHGTSNAVSNLWRRTVFHVLDSLSLSDAWWWKVGFDPNGAACALWPLWTGPDNLVAEAEIAWANRDTTQFRSGSRGLAVDSRAGYFISRQVANSTNVGQSFA